jgi:hypothetical protein
LRPPAGLSATRAPRSSQSASSDHGELVVPVQSSSDNLSRHDPKAAAEDVGRAEGGQRGHEGEQRAPGQCGIEERQDDSPQGAPAAGAEAGRCLEERGIEGSQSCPGEQIEVHVHRVGVDQENRRRTLKPPRRLIQPEQPLHQQRSETTLPIEEEEGDHPNQRWQHRRKRHQSAQDLPTGKVEPPEQKG